MNIKKKKKKNGNPDLHPLSQGMTPTIITGK